MKLSAARYTDLPLPPYAFRPGANPHPVADPAGHSYRPPGSPAPAAVSLDPARWRESPEYLYGCDLYNHAYWWEAHEAWEALWHAADQDGPQGPFLKGLIQAAACALKVEEGNRRGARTLLERSLEHLGAARARLVGPVFMGLDLDRWRASLGAGCEHLLAQPGLLRHDPNRYPYIVLEEPRPMTTELAQMECVPCKGGVPPLQQKRIDALLEQLDGWTVEQKYHLARTFRFADFAAALDFVNRIGEIAEQQNHHPDIHLAWGMVKVEVWTHKIKGLTESDFIFAAKVDRAFREIEQSAH